MPFKPQVLKNLLLILFVLSASSLSYSADSTHELISPTNSIALTETPYIDHPPLDCLIEPYMVVSVGSPSTGIIEVIPVKRGDSIHKGDLIAQLDNRLEYNAIKIAEERRDFLQEQYERALELFNKKITSRETFDQAKTELSIAKLELHRRQIQYDQKRIVSPVKGVVLERLLAPGEYAYEQTPILKIAQTDPLNAEVIVPISLYNTLSNNTNAEIKIQEPINRTLRAKIEVIDKVFDTASRTFGVRLLLPNPDLSLPAGLECQAHFISNL